MFATDTLRRLHGSIVKLTQRGLESIAARSSARIADAKAVQVAMRHGVEILGIRTAHDVMFLAYYAPGPADGPGMEALSRTALAVAALPHGLQRSDYELLVAPVGPTIRWLLDLHDDA